MSRLFPFISIESGVSIFSFIGGKFLDQTPRTAPLPGNRFLWKTPALHYLSSRCTNDNPRNGRNRMARTKTKLSTVTSLLRLVDAPSSFSFCIWRSHSPKSLMSRSTHRGHCARTRLAHTVGKDSTQLASYCLPA